jgi:hypothetical protein
MPLMLSDVSLLAHAAALSQRQVGVPGLLLYLLLVWLLPVLLLLFVGGLMVRDARPAVTRGAGLASWLNAEKTKAEKRTEVPWLLQLLPCCCMGTHSAAIFCITNMHSCGADSHQQVPCTGCR